MTSIIKSAIISAFAVLLTFQAQAQVKIGNNPTTLNSNAELEIESTDRGLLLPRVALTNTTAFAPLSAHVAGMTVYNTATAGDVVPAYYYNDGTKWVQIAAAGGSNFWALKGNAGTTPPTAVGTAVGTSNFWGTTDAQNLAVGTNGKTRMIFDQKGNAWGGGTGNVMSSDSSSLMWGSNNKLFGYNSIVAGNANVDSSRYSAVFGWGNTLGAGGGQTNRGTILSGGGNVVTGSNYNSIINGSQVTVKGACYESIITGYLTNVTNSQKVVVSGQGHNVTNATGSAVLGNFNTVNAGSALVSGAGNNVNAGGDYGVALGQNNTIGTNHANSMAIGKSVSTTGTDQFVSSFTGGYHLLGGNVGIGTPAPTTLLDVEGGTTSPAVKIVDGTQGANKVLTSDASGNASWQPAKMSLVTGTLPTTGPTMASGTNGTWQVVTGASITLPPGKWLVNMGSTGQTSTLNTNDGSTWLQFAFNDNTSAFTAPSGANTTGGTADYIAALSGNKTAGAVARGMQLTPINGVIAINNSTAGNKTYYVWAKKDSFFGGTLTAWTDIMGSSNLERYFYALPIN